ncbi:hypothetical protein HMPREF1162_0562 [ [[Propionibacterium] namnetense SK182B-JCVI]|uniref:Uncharacterized protein n=1 Tax=[Propionibacterium] namnetense SK182B-JCVI TaxID=1051006 RepID=F9NU32_9ACTN|nr:hypothetical protein HMPREF1162_0562 [ [[Propionibacterium] namnetense SK182B-JCVI]
MHDSSLPTSPTERRHSDIGVTSGPEAGGGRPVPTTILTCVR